MLLVHDGQSQAAELHILTDESMRSHQNVYASIGNTRSDLSQTTLQLLSSRSALIAVHRTYQPEKVLQPLPSMLHLTGFHVPQKIVS